MDFDLLGPLPTGTTVLEASAGTGKTYAIVGLATRCVAEGLADISQVLLVTFSRAATQELRERARERFAGVSAALVDPEAARRSDDDLVAYLATADDEEIGVRRRRLLRALAEFDAGTITTTHSFCQRMLDGLGIAGEREPDTTFVESVDDLISEVVSDLYLSRYSRTDSSPPFSTKDALAIARSAVGDGQAILEPDGEEETAPGQRVLFAAAARLEVERRKRTKGIRDFNDLLTLLHGVLTDPEYGPVACRRVREKFKVVLIDEFQDTDPLQWDILRLAFHGHTTLVLVGDPKQAIYAFRGAEVLSYLDAVDQADAHQELTTNWRSDPGLLAALEHLYGGAALGNEGIVAHPVEASHKKSRLFGPVPMRVRHLPRTGAGPLNRSGFPAVGRLRSRVADDVAADVVALLGGDARLAVDGDPRPVEPGDVAVLVRTHKHVAMIRDALDAVGVPSVLTGGSSVFATPSATQWLWLLQAIEQPHRSDRVRLTALSPIFGRTSEELDKDGDNVVAELAGQLRSYSGLFARVGFAAVFERISAETNLEKRVLAAPSGERDFTDLRHVAQLLGRVATEEAFGLSALVRWLSDRIKDPTSGSATDRSRRLDSDAAAVQIATVHATKGLEFPIVYVPFSLGERWRLQLADAAVARPGGTPHPRRRRAGRPGVQRQKDCCGGRRSGRRTAAAVRGADPGAVPTRALVGTQLRDLPLAAAPVDARTYTRHRRTCSGSEGARRRYNRSTARNLAGSSFRRDLGGTCWSPSALARPLVQSGCGRDRTGRGAFRSRPGHSVASYVVLGTHRRSAPRGHDHGQ